MKIGATEITAAALAGGLAYGVFWLYRATAPHPGTDTLGGPSIAPQDGTFAMDLAAIPGDAINTNMQGQIQFLDNVGPVGGLDDAAGYIPLYGFIPQVIGAS